MFMPLAEARLWHQCEQRGVLLCLDCGSEIEAGEQWQTSLNVCLALFGFSRANDHFCAACAESYNRAG